jgi:hypothetical protein
MSQDPRYQGKFVSVGRRFAIFALSIAAMFAAGSPGAAQTKGSFSNYQQLGCYNNPADKKIWLAAVGLTPKALDQDLYDDPNFMIIVRAGDHRFEIDGKDVVVHLMSKFDFKGAEKYKFMKYSLVVDYSGSIGAYRTDVINFLDAFIAKLPLAVEGQLIRFSDNVEKYPFTNNPADIRLQLRQPIVYGTTALHDALMEATSSLVKEGGSTPVRIIVLFTDGYDNSSQRYKDKQAFLSSFTNVVRSERIAVLVVGVTNEQDEALLNAITDRSQGIAGYYFKENDYQKLGRGLDQILQLMRNTVIFRMPKLGPDKAKAEISLAMRSQAGNISTLQVFQCEY